MRRPSVRRTAIIVATILALVGANSATARGSQQVTVRAAMTPERLGHPTTLGFGFQITTPPHEVPPALTSLQVRYPPGLGFGLSELGLDTCTTQTLEYFGPNACPTNSLMGTGTAIAEIQIGPEIIHEKAQLTIFRTEASGSASYISLLINAEGITPVFSDIILPTTLQPNGTLAIHIPLITPLPEVSPIAIVQLETTVGPKHLHYREPARGHIITYKPRGIPIPSTCPHHGFKFTAKLTFQNNTHSTAATSIPCPTHSHP